MDTLTTTELIQSIIDLLTEAYAGPPNPAATWFIDNEPDSGILGILAGVSAEEASTSVDGSEHVGTTIAGHAEHLRWSLANASAALRGETNNPKWSESWNTLNADEENWERLRGELRAEFEKLQEAVMDQEDLQGDYLNGVLALLPHAAYHLGTIRQMIERVRSDRSRI